MKTVYVAGPLTPQGNGHAAIEYLGNVRRMIRTSTILLNRGFAPFCPALDYNFFLALQDAEEMSEQHIKDYSMTWLRKCDMVLIIGLSSGVEKEMLEAACCGIPIYTSLQDLLEAE